MLGYKEDGDFKSEAAKMYLFLLANRGTLSEIDRNILLLLSIGTPFRPRDDLKSALLSAKLTTEIFSSKSAVATAFLQRQNITQIRADWKSNLSGVEQRTRFADKVLPGAKYLEFLLTPTDQDFYNEATSALPSLVAYTGSNLDQLIWLLKSLENYNEAISTFVTRHFASLPANTADPSQLSRIDLEVFLVALVNNQPQNTLEILPFGRQVVNRVDQRAFWQAASCVSNNEAVKSSLALLRKTVKTGKNVIRLNGAQPALEIVAAAGKYLAETDRPDDAIRYLESIEHHLGKSQNISCLAKIILQTIIYIFFTVLNTNFEI